MKWSYFNPLFEYEDILAFWDSAWTGHRYFIYDLIRNIQPRTIVELGTHKGLSFFSMCQAVKDGKINSKLYAIDTWEGDKHAGFYDESVLMHVKNIINTHYAEQDITLLKKTFDQAIDNFSNTTIDIIHIDGLHTYEAVRHDFQQWFPKLSKNGLMLLHDTHEKRNDFGVYRLWKELKDNSRTIEFYHSHGLGILFKNTKVFNRISIFEDIWKLYYSLLSDHLVLSYRFKEMIKDANEIYGQRIRKTQMEIDTLKQKIDELQSSKIVMLPQLFKIK